MMFAKGVNYVIISFNSTMSFTYNILTFTYYNNFIVHRKENNSKVASTTCSIDYQKSPQCAINKKSQFVDNEGFMF